MSRAMAPILEVESLRKAYGEKVVLHDISLSVAPHDVVCLIGASGSGKSTLLRCLNLLEDIQDGVITFDGREISDPRVDPRSVRSEIGYMVNEGLAMLAEGVAPYTIERATTQAGYPAPVLQLTDELNMELMAKIGQATREAEGDSYVGHPGEVVVQKMLEAGRPGKLRGAGFYEYADGKRGSIWSGLADLFPVAEQQIPLQDVKDRMLFAEALETAKCFEEGVVTSAAHANIGSIFGIGFPPATGGAAQFVTGYEAADGSIGINAFLARADELAERYGERFRATAYLRDLAAKGDSYPA